MNFLRKFFKTDRIISQGKYVPEIDSLRFIAIVSVVLYHIYWFLLRKDLNQYQVKFDPKNIFKFIENGHLGVALFFIISGYILANPFYKNYKESAKTPNLKPYFIRRLTRLEPPYILTLIIFFIAQVWIVSNLDFNTALKSLVASIFYVHNFFYPLQFPYINTVTWSLEIEVQFYILAPFLSLIFLFKGNSSRIILSTLIIIFTWISCFIELPFVSIINYAQYFLMGMLMVSFPRYNFKNEWLIKLCVVFSVLFLLFSWHLDKDDVVNLSLKFFTEISYLFLSGLFFYLVIKTNAISFMKNNFIARIGGMCYSTYLIHFVAISFLGNKLVGFQLSNNQNISILLNGAILCIFIFSISTIFFMFFERPFMKKDWHKSIFTNNRSNLS